MTESLFDLGAGNSLVGITDFCMPPALAEPLPRVGGTKAPRVADILELSPELVLANQEENSLDTVDALEKQGVKVWVTFPRTVDDCLSILWTLVRLFQVPSAAPRVKTIEVTLEWTSRASATRPPARVFCPIWKGEREGDEIWWMTFNAQTYAHDLLLHCGGLNVFAQRERRYPLAADLGRGEPRPMEGRDVRYPRVTADEVRAAGPEVILLPSEPFAFSPADAEQIRRELEKTPAVTHDRVHLIDGSLVTWHGTRLARSLVELPPLLEGLAASGTSLTEADNREGGRGPGSNTLPSSGDQEIRGQAATP
jgi:ABC-type hemin transport system substrate-binding protein